MPVTRLFLVFICQQVIAANAQTITIISAHTNDPLPFATIQNLRALWAMVGSEKGAFTFTDVNSKSGDTILISFTGYLPIRMVKPEVTTTLKMEPLPEMLQPVEVLPCKGMEIESIKNYYNGKSSFGLSSNAQAIACWAAYIPNSSATKGILSSIQFWLSKNDLPKNGEIAPFRVRLFNYNKSTNLPGLPFLQKNILVYPKAQKVVIDLSEEWLRLPENGIVVAIEFFYAGEQFVKTYKTTFIHQDGSRTDTIMRRYGTNIESVKGNDLKGNGFDYLYKINEWRVLEDANGQKWAPKIELLVKLCE